MTARFAGLVLRDWRTRLVHDHPRLFPDARLVPGGDGPSAGPALASAGWPEVPDGWAGVLATACARLDALLAREGEGAEAAIVDVSEKYGSLRLDVVTAGLSAAGEAVVAEIVDLAEAGSAHACAVCGGRGRAMERGGWITPLCPAHADGHAPVPGDHALLITIRLVGGRPVRSARRYRPHLDRFVAVPVPPEE